MPCVFLVGHLLLSFFLFMLADRIARESFGYASLVSWARQMLKEGAAAGCLSDTSLRRTLAITVCVLIIHWASVARQATPRRAASYS